MTEVRSVIERQRVEIATLTDTIERLSSGQGVVKLQSRIKELEAQVCPVCVRGGSEQAIVPDERAGGAGDKIVGRAEFGVKGGRRPEGQWSLWGSLKSIRVVQHDNDDHTHWRVQQDDDWTRIDMVAQIPLRYTT